MDHDGRFVGLPQVDFLETKANIEALANLEEGMTAGASDSNEFGYYDGSAWHWSQLDLNYLTGATYVSVQDFVNYHSSGFISEIAITDSGSGEIDVAAGTGVIRAAATETDPAYFFDWDADTNIVLTDKDTNWVFIKYGTPATVEVDVDITNIDLLTEIVIGRVYRDGDTLYIINVGQKLADYFTGACYKDFEVYGFQRADGMIVSEPANLKLKSTAGVLYCAHNRLITAAKDTNVADTFIYWYSDGGAGWTQIAAQTDIDPDHYDDGDGVLGDVSNNNFGVHWVYIDFTGGLHVQFGTGNYNKLSDAQAAPVPTPPNFFRDFTILSARVICEQGAASFDELLSAFQQEFSGTPVTDHNDLANLQGGTAAEYYHLDAADYAILADGAAQRYAFFCGGA